MRDSPLSEIAGLVSLCAALGGTVHQQWTCCGCGHRGTVEVPNRLFRSIACECGAITDVSVTGCGYVSPDPVVIPILVG